jgi:hypothetical protein
VDRRFRRIGLLVRLVCMALLSARVAQAAPNDAAAQKLRDQAIDQDYLATNYVAAEKKLNDALTLCQKTTECSPFIRARVHADLGVVEYMLHKVDLARTEFATALLEDPSVDLDKDLSNSDVQREFAAVKSGGPTPTTAPSTPAPAGSAPVAPQTGGITHSPPISQQVQTPLPLYAEVGQDLGITKVIVRYKPVGAKDWKTATLNKVGGGFGGEIPCSDVGSSEGELQYYIQALDTNGDLVAASGRSATPHAVSIVKKLKGEGPHLPNEPPPQACKPGSATSGGSTLSASPEASDCPPGFPGCRSEGPSSCESKEDCMAGEECVDHVCERGSEATARTYKKNWLSLGVQADLMLMPGANDACLGDSGYTCFRSDNGNYYADVPQKGVDDQVLGGIATSPMLRVLVGYDRVVSPNLTLGGRLGYAFFGGGPQRPVRGTTDAGPNFMPVHVEARLSYYLGKNVFARKGARFYGFASGGLMEIDASQAIDVVPASAFTTRSQIAIDAWRKVGTGFGAVGPGLMFAITPNSGFVVEPKAIVLFPTFGIAFAAQLAYTIGL